MVYKVYHGTNENFTRFNVRKGAQGVMWFSSDRDKIERGDSGAAGRTKILTCQITINNPAGWEEYEKYGLGEIQNMGFDGIILDDDFIVFENNQIKILKEVKSLVNKILLEADYKWKDTFPMEFTFLYRDVTHYPYPEQKWALVKRLQKLQSEGGKSLPMVSIKIGMLIPVQTDKFVDSPFAVKMNGIFYLITGKVPHGVNEYDCHVLDLDKENNFTYADY